MTRRRISVAIARDLLAQLDDLIVKKVFASRSQAIQTAVREKLARMRRSRLAEECAKLDPSMEKAMAEEGMSGELAQCPKY